MTRSSSRKATRKHPIVQVSKKRGITTTTTVLGLVGMLGLATAFVGLTPDGSGSSSGSQGTVQAEPLRSEELRGLLNEAGLNARSLTAAGASPSQASGLIAAVQSRANESRVSLRSLKQAMLDAQRDLQRAYMPNQEGGEDASGAQTFKQLQSTAESAQTAYEEARNNLFQAAYDGVLTADQVAAIQRIKDNTRFRVPLEYLVVDRTQQEWVLLREALSQKDAAEREFPAGSALGTNVPDELSPDAERIVAEADGDPAVVVAKQSLGSNYEGIATAWKQAMAESNQ